MPDRPDPAYYNNGGDALSDPDQISSATAAILVVVGLDECAKARDEDVEEHNPARFRDGVNMIVTAHLLDGFILIIEVYNFQA